MNLEEIPEGECWRLLEGASIGRIATLQLHSDDHEDGIDIFPVNYLVRDKTVLFRSGPGTKLMEIAQHHSVVFEVDGHKGPVHWSVIVHGRAERLAVDTQIEDSGVLDLESLHPGEKSSFVRITPEVVTGRQFRHQHPDPADRPTESHPTPGAQQPPAHPSD